MPRNDNSEEDFEKSVNISLTMGNALDLQTFSGANISYVKTWGLKINFFHTFYKI